MNERADCPSSSALDRMVECVASHNMGVLAQSWNQNKEMPSEDADFGIRVHEALEKGSAKGLQTDEERLAFSVMHRQKEKFVKSWGLVDRDTVEWREHRMWMHHGVAPVFTGKADYVLIRNGRALILDYKSLWNKVPDPKDNHQLKSLAVLLWVSNQHLHEITVQIISSHYDYTAFVMSTEDLKQYLAYLESVIKSVNQASAPVPGAWCKHCRGLLICPAVKKKASDLVKATSDDEWPSRLPVGPSGASVLDYMTTLSSLIEKVKDHYKTVLADNPKAIPGWALQTKVTKKFKDVRHVFGMLSDKLDADVFDLITISVPKAFDKLNTIEQATLEQYLEKTTSAPFLRKKDNGLQEK